MSTNPDHIERRHARYLQKKYEGVGYQTIINLLRKNLSEEELKAALEKKQAENKEKRK